MKTILSILFAVVLAGWTPDELADAIWKAEGGHRAKKPYGILSVPCSGEIECRKICLNTIKNNLKRWRDAGSYGDYLEFLARRYAPIFGNNLTNNERILNQNWLKNVRFYLRGKNGANNY